tara:strand:+ start:968 stop:1225 length:258 start_codon:yes stop_codon:yes gene_type:complete
MKEKFTWGKKLAKSRMVYAHNPATTAAASTGQFTAAMKAAMFNPWVIGGSVLLHSKMRGWKNEMQDDIGTVTYRSQSGLPGTSRG